MSLWIDAQGRLHCPGCDKIISQLDAFHARDCTSKQTRLDKQ